MPAERIQSARQSPTPKVPRSDWLMVSPRDCSLKSGRTACATNWYMRPRSVGIGSAGIPQVPADFSASCSSFSMYIA